MSAVDLAVGYPVHALARYAKEDNGHGVTIWSWAAVCGAGGTIPGGVLFPFKTARHARKAELCKTCWPTGHRDYHPEAVEVEKL